jgi:hypothetical protein
MKKTRFYVRSVRGDKMRQRRKTNEAFSLRGLSCNRMPKKEILICRTTAHFTPECKPIPDCYEVQMASFPWSPALFRSTPALTRSVTAHPTPHPTSISLFFLLMAKTHGFHKVVKASAVTP